MILRELINKFGFEIDDAALARADKQVASFSKKLQKVGESATRIGKKLTIGATLPILGIGAAFIKAASDAEETDAKFKTVFQDVSDESEKTAKNLAKNFGLSQDSAKELLGDTGDLLTGFGFTGKSALKLSDDVQKLAVDLASFTNFTGGAEGASKALTKALLGERESVKSLGISILEEDVKKEVALLRTQGLTFETERQAKAQATLNIAMRQSKNAIGDFARTSQGFANQTRILGGEINDLAVSFGKILLPIALKLVKVIRRAVNFFTELPQPVKTTILVVLGLVAALGPLLLAFGLFITVGGPAIAVLIKMALAIKAMGITALVAQAQLLLIPLAILAVIGAIALIADDINAFLEGRDSVFGRLIVGLEAAFGSLAEKFQGFGLVARSVIAGLLAPLRAMINIIKTGVALFDVLSGNATFSEFFGAAKENLRNTFDPSQTTSSFGGALGFGGGGASPLSGLADTARANQAVSAAQQISQSAELNVNVLGLPPEAAKEVAQASITESLGQILRDTARSARPAMER